MNNKGIGGHVDWIIGIGLFLIYIALMFAFFKPGVSDVFEHDTLLDIVEEGFRSDVEWNLTKTPLFLEALPSYTCETSDGWTTPSGVENSVGYFMLEGFLDQEEEEYDANAGFALELPSRNDMEVYYVPADVDDDPYDHLEDAVEGVLLNAEDGGRPYSVMFDDDPEDLILPAVLSQGSGKYVLISSLSGENINDGTVLSVDRHDTCDVDAAGNNQNHFLACRVANYDESTFDPQIDNNECMALYSVGVTEHLYGMHKDIVSPQIFNYLEETEDFAGCTFSSTPTEQEVYTCAKAEWGYPPLKEFKIFVEYDDDSDGEQTLYEFPGIVVPYNVRVDSRMYNDFVLTEEGLRVPATVNILVW